MKMSSVDRERTAISPTTHLPQKRRMRIGPTDTCEVPGGRRENPSPKPRAREGETGGGGRGGDVTEATNTNVRREKVHPHERK